MKTYLYRASNLKYTITFLASVSKTVDSCDLFILIIIIIITNFFRWVFSESTEAVATSHINFPEICAFIIGFSFTVWTKMRPLMAY